MVCSPGSLLRQEKKAKKGKRTSPGTPTHKHNLVQRSIVQGQSQAAQPAMCPWVSLAPVLSGPQCPVCVKGTVMVALGVEIILRPPTCEPNWLVTDIPGLRKSMFQSSGHLTPGPAGVSSAVSCADCSAGQLEQDRSWSKQ
jgi:hypothetical protein